MKLIKVAIHANRDDTHDLHRLVDDLFAQLQERLTSETTGPAALKMLLTDITGFLLFPARSCSGYGPGVQRPRWDTHFTFLVGFPHCCRQ